MQVDTISQLVAQNIQKRFYILIQLTVIINSRVIRLHVSKVEHDFNGKFRWNIELTLLRKTKKLFYLSVTMLSPYIKTLK